MIVQPVKAGYGELWARLILCALIVAGLFFWVANAWSRTPLGILRALESLPTYKHDRGPEHAELKAEQNARVSAAIASVARDADEAAMLLTIGWHESAWSLAIENGRCAPKQCDPDKNGVPRAHSNFQIHKVAASSPEAWEAARTDVKVAAQEAAFVLRRMRGMCASKRGDLVRMTLVAYAGRNCGGRLKDIEARVATFKRLRARVQ